MSNGAWIARLGKMLKESRAGRYTVEELATKAGVSAGLVSQIERGIGNPSFATLMRLSQALDLPVVAMFHGPQFNDTQMLVRRAERRRMEVPSDRLVHEMLVPNTNRKLGMITTTIPPGFSNEDLPYSHEGEEIILVASGKLHASVGGQTFDLEEGDTLTYESALPHAWTNRTKKPVTIIAVSTPPSSGAAH
jgi:transcriptional regulator with XRE-family HTH domain